MKIKVQCFTYAVAAMLFSTAHAANSSQSKEEFPFAQVRDNLLAYYLHQPTEQPRSAAEKRLQHRIDQLRVAIKIDLNTIELLQKQSLDYPLAKTLLETMNDRGAWPDINYADSNRSNWEPYTHIERLSFLTRVYLQPGSPLYRNRALSAALHRGMSWWFENDFQNPNWWYQSIGVPKAFGPVFVMLQNELSPEEHAAAVRLLGRSKIGMTGQNRVWLAGNVFYRALLTGDAALARQARDAVFAEIKISSGEGIQADFSYHQHGPQQQFGNYGLAFVNSMTFWGRLFRGTDAAMSREQTARLRSLLFDGYDRVIWNGRFDISALGRQLFKGTQQMRALLTATCLTDMMQIDPDHAPHYRAALDRICSREAPQPLLGNRHFWRSDYTVHHAPGWYASVKMSSERVVGTEAGNGENLKGYYLADGATYIQVDGDEYLDLFPCWDWRKLPGTTCPQQTVPLPVLSWNGYRNGSAFTGGLSSGQLGIAATHLNRDGLAARKSWFFFREGLVCLGAGITDTNSVDVLTSLNQCRLEGPVRFATDTEQQLPFGSVRTVDGLRWVLHDGIGYCMLEEGRMTLSAKEQDGDWHEITRNYPSEIISMPVFGLYWNHGRAPQHASYAYAVLPGATREALEQPPFRLLRNDPGCQAVASADGTVHMFTVHRPLTVQLPRLGSVRFREAGLYLFEQLEGKLRITCADPVHALKTTTLMINGKAVTFELPSGPYSGAAVSRLISQP